MRGYKVRAEIIHSVSTQIAIVVVTVYRVQVTSLADSLLVVFVILDHGDEYTDLAR